MADLPDYYTQAQISEAEAAGFKGGLDANKSATPVSRNIYLATDTHILYVCFTDGTWTGFDASILTQGILTLYADMAGGGFEIKNIKDPTAAQSAATRAYALAQIAVHAALTATHGIAGTIAGLADIATHAALTATHGIAGTIAGLADIVSYIATHAALATGIHNVGASTVESATGSQAKVDTHAALTTAHGAVSAATASKMVVRDAEGQAAFAAPAAAGDALIKGTALTITEMAALTTDKMWKGAANRPTEVDAPSATKEFFVPVSSLCSPALAAIGDFYCVPIAATGYVYFNLKVPWDFSSLTSCVVLVWNASAGTIDWTVTTDFGAIGQVHTTHSDSDTADAVAIPLNQITGVNIAAALTDLAAGDYVGVKFAIDALSIGALKIIGLSFRYS